MEVIMDIIAIIGITLLIIDIIMSFYQLIVGNKKEKLHMVILLLMQIILLYGGYRAISFFNG